MAKGLAMEKRESLSASSTERKTRVFISYSRKDATFADTLVEALNARGFEAFLDKKDILPGEPWRERIGALILTADAVVFIISPDSVSSGICGWEIDEAGRLQKKLLPVLRRDVVDAQVPAELSRLNYIFLRAEDDFDIGLAALDAAIDTDIAWIRQHTRISELTRRWEDASRRHRGLLSGEDILEAERWRDSHPREAPPATEAQLAFITASRQAATQRQRYTIGGSLAVAAIALGLAGFAYVQRERAVENEVRAVKERDQALTTQSRFLADLAQQMAASGDEVTAMLLALEALPARQGERPYVPQAEVSLYAGRFGRGEGLREVAVLKGQGDQIRNVAFGANGTRIVSASLEGTGRLWDGRTGAEIAVLKGHAESVDFVAFSRDGGRIVTASRDGTARIWDSKTGAPLVVLGQHGESVNRAAFVADGTRVVTTSGTGIRLWSVETGKLVAVLEPKEDKRSWRSAAVSSDGLRIVTDSAGTTARLWDARTAAEIAVLSGHEGSIRKIGFSADSTRVVTASEDKTARVWDGRTGARLAVFRYEGRVDGAFNPDAALSPDGSRLVASEDGSVLWDVKTQAKIAVLPSHKNPVNEIGFNSDGTRFFTKSVDAVRLWDTRSGAEIAPLKGHKDMLQEAAFSDDGKRLITTSHDKTARLWDSRTGAEIATLAAHEDSVWNAAFSPDGTNIVTQTSTALRLWSAPTVADVAVLKHDGEVNGAAFSPDGKRIVTLQDTVVRLWDPDNARAPLASLRHKKQVNHAAFSADGSRIVTASDDGTIHIWGSNGAEIATLKARDEKAVATVAFSPDGARIVASSDGKTQIWDIEKRSETTVLTGGDAVFTPDGAQIMTVSGEGVIRFWDAVTVKESGALETDESPINGLALSPDGARLVIAAGSETNDARAIVWDIRTRTKVALAKNESGQQFNSVVFSPDGSRILTASNDETARIWNAATGAPIAVLRGHEGVLRSAAFSPDGTRVVTASHDKTVRIFRVFPDTKALIEQARQDVTRCLTAAERRQFFLPDEPPGWCIETGKWPYSTSEWKTWLAAKLSGKAQPLPAQAE